MEAKGQRLASPSWGPLTSTPKAAPRRPPPTPPPTPTSSLLERVDSSSSLCSASSEEDWLIKVCCPGARHRYCKHTRTKKPPKIEFHPDLDKEDELAGCTSALSYQSFLEVPRKESSDLGWLIRLRCPRAQMEPRTSDPKQSLPAVPSTSKAERSDQSARAKPTESWLMQKHLSALQAVVSEQQCSPQCLLQRENCFVREVDRYLKHNDFLALRKKEMLYKKWFDNVSSPLLQKIQEKVDSQSSEEIEERKRKQLSLYLDFCNKQHGAYLESYDPSVYDPYFLKSTDIWKVSVPPFCDPLLKEVQERYLEEGIIQQCDTGRMYSSREMSEVHKADLPLLPLSRRIMDPIEWLKMPSGYIESEVHQKSRRKMSTARNKSTMDFKCWDDQSRLQPKRFTSARKTDLASVSSLLAKQRLGGSSSFLAKQRLGASSSLLAKQRLGGSSIWKPVIKSAS